MPTPSCCRNAHSSTTCGSQAAWRISVTPGARGGGEQRRLGAGHRRLVEIDRRRLQAVRRLEHVAGAVDLRAPIATSASRCVAIVRRAGKSPPGGARCARPRRASSGPSSSTEPRSRPTSAPSGSSLIDLAAAHAQRRVPMPSTSAPRSSEQPRHHLDVADPRHVGEHALFGRQQARGQQRQRGVLVAFDVDARRTGGWPPSISSVDMMVESVVSRVSRSRRDTRSPRAARRRSCSRTARGTARSARGCPRAVARALVDDEVAVRRRDARAADAPRPSARRDRPARRPTTECRPAPRRGPAPDSERCSRRSACRAAASACGTPATARAVARSAAGSPRDDAKHRRQQHLARSLQPAAIVAERHRRRRRRRATRRRGARAARRSTSSPISRPPKCALPKIAPPTVPGVPAQASRPAQPWLIVQRTSPLIVTAASARTRSSSIARTSPPRGRITRPRTPASATSTFEPPPSTVTGTPRGVRQSTAPPRSRRCCASRPASRPARRRGTW